jgi:hypothetical protein
MIILLSTTYQPRSYMHVGCVSNCKSCSEIYMNMRPASLWCCAVPMMISPRISWWSDEWCSYHASSHHATPFPCTLWFFLAATAASTVKQKRLQGTNDVTRLMSRRLTLRGSLNTVRKPVSYSVFKACYVITLRKLKLNINYYLMMYAGPHSGCVLKFPFAGFIRGDLQIFLIRAWEASSCIYDY